MSPGPEDQWRPPEPPGRNPRPGGPNRPTPRPRWMPWLIIGLLVALFLFWQGFQSTTPARATIQYSQFLDEVTQGHVDNIKYDASTGKITGKFAKNYTPDGKSEFTAQGQPDHLPDADIATLNKFHVGRNYKGRSTDWLATALVWLLPIALLVGVWWFMAR